MRALWAAAVLPMLSVPATAEIRSYHVALDGTSMLVPTGSTATGSARVKVDTDRQVVSVEMDVRGIKLDDLWKTLVAKPIGPVHFHKYGSHHHMADDVVLILPLPYGDDYRPASARFPHFDEAL